MWLACTRSKVAHVWPRILAYGPVRTSVRTMVGLRMAAADGSPDTLVGPVPPPRLHQIYGTTADPSATPLYLHRRYGVSGPEQLVRQPGDRVPGIVHHAAAVSALDARLGGFFQSHPDLLVQALSHESAAPRRSSIHNGRLALLGHSLLRHMLTDSLLAKYPNLPASKVSTTVDLLSGAPRLAAWARAVALQPLIRWAPSEPGDGSPGSPESRQPSDRITADTVAAVIGAVYAARGVSAVRSFLFGQVVRDTPNLSTLLRTDRPKAALHRLCLHRGTSLPTYAILEETGRSTHRPIFLVGIYVDGELMAEGAAGSIRAAQNAAAQNAIDAHYLKDYDRHFPGAPLDFSCDPTLSPLPIPSDQWGSHE